MPTDSQIRTAFDRVAETIHGDIFEVCRELGEPCRVERDGCMDYLDTFGGEHGTAVMKWLQNIPGTWADMEIELDRIGVPKTWI